MDCDLWPVPDGECAGGCTIPDDIDPDVLTSASVQAGTILYTLSGQRVGQCADTVRPLNECGCRNTCVCANAGDRVRLYSPRGPITAVEGVDVGGVPVDPSEWRFYPSGQTLYRVPPTVWPQRDLKWGDCGDPDTMCVNVLIGNPPDPWALSVHAELTCELIKSCTDTKGCRLPRNATQVTGQGITVQLSPTELKQFLPSVAGWVAAVNPDNAQTVTKVFSPDLDRAGGGGCGCP